MQQVSVPARQRKKKGSPQREQAMPSQKAAIAHSETIRQWRFGESQVWHVGTP